MPYVDLFGQLSAKLSASLVLAIALMPFGGSIARADDGDPVFLLDTQCVETGLGRWQEEKQDITVGRKVYRSYMFGGPGSREASLTCRITPDEDEDIPAGFRLLQLQFGMRDRDPGRPATIVNIYLDGERSASRRLFPGELAELVLDVTDIENVAIETVCSTPNQYCDRVYFFQSEIAPTTSLPEALRESAIDIEVNGPDNREPSDTLPQL
ncbi:hypothetical protein [Oxynema aestuarii]|uniref:Uncharacterized protein n=1 Tax=Oxynema aestuarii AP17 TaxID=2064643 RepID=A0A6H1TXP5_9CYAN|nr:hypothetical protein [Oxynema aestuarii]QIZ70543.1 hypothetical protein HCG48_08065 [Oxynema aestuarii AP17]